MPRHGNLNLKKESEENLSNGNKAKKHLGRNPLSRNKSTRNTDPQPKTFSIVERSNMAIKQIY